MFCNFHVLSIGLFLFIWWLCFYLSSIWWCVLLQLWEILFYFYFDIHPASLSCCFHPEFLLARHAFNFSSSLSYFLTLQAFVLYILGDVLSYISQLFFNFTIMFNHWNFFIFSDYSLFITLCFCFINVILWSLWTQRFSEFFPIFLTFCKTI